MFLVELRLLLVFVKIPQRLLPLTLTRVSSRAELTISLCEDTTEALVDVNTQCVNDAITLERRSFRENAFF